MLYHFNPPESTNFHHAYKIKRPRRGYRWARRPRLAGGTPARHLLLLRVLARLLQPPEVGPLHVFIVGAKVRHSVGRELHAENGIEGHEGIAEAMLPLQIRVGDAFQEHLDLDLHLVPAADLVGLLA